MAIRAAVLGASGFAGGELLRLLAVHPAVRVVAAGASSQAGKPVTDVFPGLRSLSGARFLSMEEALGAGVDIVFCSLPHGESSRLIPSGGSAAVVDLAGDFRLKDASVYEQWYGEQHPSPSSLPNWIYGLSEFHKDEILKAGKEPKKIANPGCYAAASILALGPLVEAGLVEAPIHISAMSGVSGAGRAQGAGFDFTSANENVRAYKPVGHNHIGEIEQELSLLAGGGSTPVSFVPHLVPMSRGIFVTAAAVSKGGGSRDRFRRVLQDRYADEPFVHVLEQPAMPETKRLSGTNAAEVAVTADGRSGKVLAFAALDNLGKGAAGQAIQNANLIFGLEETTGLVSEGLLA